MKQKRYIITLDSFDYNILENNSMIMTCCGSLLKKVKMKDDEVKLLLTEYELKELTGFVAAEANHATSKIGVWTIISVPNSSVDFVFII